MKGAGRGAALGAVGGAITGNTGKAPQEVMGGIAGGLKRRDQQLAQANQQQHPAQSSQQTQRAAYQRAMTACLEGRGYTVKQVLLAKEQPKTRLVAGVPRVPD